MSIPLNNSATGEQYGFYGRLRAEFPSQVIIDTTQRCNLSCIHCPHATFRKSAYYTGEDLDPILNNKAIDEVRDHGIGITQYIRYSAEGETLMHSQFFEMLEYATHNGGGVPVTISTNGTLLDAAHAQRLIASGVSLVDFSIDAFSPLTYARIRRHGDLTAVQLNVIRLVKLAREHGNKTKVVVSFIEQPLNAGEVADFEKYWKDQGLDFVVVRRRHSASGFLNKIAREMRQSAPEVRRPCVYPWERIVLNPKGHLSFCPADWTGRATIADYRQTTITELWHGPFYQALRSAHLRNDFSRHPFCGCCPDWSAVRWPEEGRGYANMVEELTTEK